MPLPLKCDRDLILAADRQPAVNGAGLRARAKPVGSERMQSTSHHGVLGPENNVLHQIYHGRCTHSGTRWGASVLCQTHGRPGFRVCRGDRPLAVTAEAAVRNLETGGPAKISVNHTQSKNRERTQSEPDVC